MTNILLISTLFLTPVFGAPASKEAPTEAELKLCVRLANRASKLLEQSPWLDGARAVMNGKVKDLQQKRDNQVAAEQRKTPITDKTFIHPDPEKSFWGGGLAKLIDEVGREWRYTPGRSGRRTEDPEAPMTEKTFEILGGVFNRARDREFTRFTGSSDLRQTLKKILKDTIQDPNEYKALFLAYGLDGNGTRSPKEIGEQLGCDGAKASRYVEKGRKALHGKPGLAIMKLVAKDVGEELKYREGVGWYTTRSLSAFYWQHRNQRDAMFERVPLDVLELTPTTIQKVQSELGFKNLHELAPYFRKNVFEVSEVKIPFTREELKEIYDKIKPIFWPDQEYSIRFLDRLYPQ